MDTAALLAAAAAALCGLPLAHRRRIGLLLAALLLVLLGAPVRAALPPPPYRSPLHAPVAEVEVRRGDSLWAISVRALLASGRSPTVAAVDRHWRRLYELNRAVIGDDPDLIRPGQVLVLPDEGTGP